MAPSPRTALRATTAVLLLAALSGLAGNGVPAQSAPVDTAATRARKDSLRAATIQAEDIPSQADQTTAQLRDLESLLAPDPAVIRIVQLAPTLGDTMDATLAAHRLVTSRLLTRRALIEFSLEWERRAAETREWRRTLRNRTSALQEARSQTTELDGRWTAAIEVARQDSTTGTVLSLARETLRSVREIDRRLKNRLDDLLSAEVQVSDVQLRIQQQQQLVARQVEEQRKDLFRVDSPPLWRIGEALSGTAVIAQAKAIISEDRGALAAFAQTYGGRLLLHLVLTLLLIQFFRKGHARLKSDPDDPLHAEPAAVILERPEAAVLLIAALSVLWAYPRAPLMIYDLALLLSVAPLLRLRAVLVPEPLRLPGQFVGLFLVVQRIVALSLPTTALERIATFLISIAAAILLWMGLRPGGVLGQDGGSRWVAVVIRVARVLLVGFVLAAIANLIGNVSLASTLVATLILLSYQGMVLVAGTKVLDVALAEGIRIASQHSVFVRTYGGRIRDRGYRLIDLAAVVTWLWVALFSFYLTDNVAAILKGWLGGSWTLGEVELSLGTVLLFIAVIWLGALIARFISLVLELDVLGRLSLPRGVPVTVASLVRYALVGIAFLVALAATGFQLGQLAIIGGALGVGIGFGLQNIVANFIAGLILAFERPISVGDTVQLAEMIGEVRQIGIRASIIRTFDGAEVIVPNSELISREVINWTRSDRLRRIEVLVGVAYGTDPKRVIELLLESARAHPEVATAPGPDARFMGFGDSSLDFSLRFWADYSRWTLIQSSVALAVHDAISAAGITIPFPQRDLHLVSASPDVVRQLGPSAGKQPGTR